MPTTLHSLPNELVLDILTLLSHSPAHLPYDLPALISSSSKCAKVYFAHRVVILRTALQTFLGNFALLAEFLAVEEKFQFSGSEPDVEQALKDGIGKLRV